MSQDKTKITSEMVEAFREMILSPDKGDITLALDILDNRDKDDVESEKYFKNISTQIISNDQLFPNSNMWVVKAMGKPIVINDKMVFMSKSAAERQLSTHLTKYIGVSSTKLKSSQLRSIRYKRLSHKKYYLKDPSQYKIYKFDAQDEQELIKQYKKENEAVGYRAQWSGANTKYFEAIKMFFKGGKELRDFLINNNILTIEQL